jgi:hypothetical protein
MAAQGKPHLTAIAARTSRCHQSQCSYQRNSRTIPRAALTGLSARVVTELSQNERHDC